jgi:hypothetical protein
MGNAVVAAEARCPEGTECLIQWCDCAFWRLNRKSLTQSYVMFRQKRGDTLVGTIEAQYGIDLHARSDMTLENLLEYRGFDSFSQLLAAYRGDAKSHARRRRLFLSFHAEDRQQVQGFRLVAYNENIDLEFYDGSLQEPINSERAAYIKRQLKSMIQRASVLVCLIGNGTAWREWVDWELRTSIELGKGICGVRLKGSRGRTPPLLSQISAPVAQWHMRQIIAAIECAAARRT